jgi:DMSO/TMAO reductase YedYZ heme-binding membrane subunit
LATTRSRPRGREHARPSSGGVASEHATKIYTVALAGIAVILALTSIGHVIDAATQHFMLFYAGVFALIALCASVGLGLVATDRMFLSPGHRVVVQSAHRAASFGAVTFLIIHIVTEILAQRVHVLDAVVPFLSPFRTFYIGLGTIASDLIILLVITGIMRGRFNANGKAWRWRAIHYVSYLSFVFGVWHGLLAGRPGKPYVDWSYGFVVALVAIGLAVRIFSHSLRPKESLSGAPVPTGASSASAPMRAAAMFAQLSAARVAGQGRLVLSATAGPVLSAPVAASHTAAPMLSAPLSAPVSRLADSGPLTWGTDSPQGGHLVPIPSGGPHPPWAPSLPAPAPAGQVQAGPKYEPGYEGPPRYLGVPRDLGTGSTPRLPAGPLPRAGSGPIPRAGTGPIAAAGWDSRSADTGWDARPADAGWDATSADAGWDSSLPADGPGYWPQAEDGSLSDWGSGHRPGAPTGPQPRMPSGPQPRMSTGPFPRSGTSPMPRAATGPMPRAGTGSFPRSDSGPMPRADSGWFPRADSGPMPQAATGPYPRLDTGPMPRAASGPFLRATGPQPQVPANPYPYAGTGPMARAASGPMPRGASGPMPRGASGPMPRGASGPMPRGASGPMPRAASGPQPRYGSGPSQRRQTGPIQRPQTGPMPRAGSGPMPAAGHPMSRPDFGGQPDFGQPDFGQPDFGGRPGRRGWPGGGRADDLNSGMNSGRAPWDGGFPEPDPDFRYREPGPGMPGYRGSRDHRYGGDVR